MGKLDLEYQKDWRYKIEHPVKRVWCVRDTKTGKIVASLDYLRDATNVQDVLMAMRACEENRRRERGAKRGAGQ